MSPGVHGSPGVIELTKHGVSGGGSAIGKGFNMNAALRESEEVPTRSTSTPSTADSEKVRERVREFMYA